MSADPRRDALLKAVADAQAGSVGSSSHPDDVMCAVSHATEVLTVFIEALGARGLEITLRGAK